MEVINERLVDLTGRIGRIETMLTQLVSQHPGREWLTTAEAAEVLGKAEFTVREWCRLGRIAARKQASGRGAHPAWVISRSELDRYRREGLLPLR